MRSFESIIKQALIKTGLKSEATLELAPQPNFIANEVEADNYFRKIVSEENFLEQTKLRAQAMASTVIPAFRIEDYFEPEPGYEASGARILGKGAHGLAKLYRFKFYNVNDATLGESLFKIKQLCDEEGLIVIKRELHETGNGITQAEQEITNHLFKEKGNYNQAFAATIINEKNENEPVILSRYACFAKNPFAEKPKSHNKSYSLKSFIEKMHAVATGKQPPNKKVGKTAHAVYGSAAADFDIMLAQIGSSMMDSIRSLHKTGVYHLDIAPRNFLMDKIQCNANGEIVKMSALAADFGEGTKYNLETGLSYENIRGSGPIRCLDLAILNKVGNKYTARTDLYALRISLLNMLSVDLGFDENAAIFIRPGEALVYNCHNRIKLCGNNDSQALAHYADNFNNLLNKKLIFINNKKADLQALQEIMAVRHTDIKKCLSELAKLKIVWRVNKDGLLNNINAIDLQLKPLHVQHNKIVADLVQTNKLKMLLTGQMAKLINQKTATAKRELESITKKIENLQKEITALENKREDLAEAIVRQDKIRQELVDRWYWFDHLDKSLDENISLVAQDMQADENLVLLSEWDDYLDDLNYRIAGLLDSVITREEMAARRAQLFMNSYSSYIAHTPWDYPANDESDIKKTDYQRYLMANEDYFLRTLIEKLASFSSTIPEQARAFALAVTRLFGIAVSAEFKELSVYQQLARYLKEANPQVLDIAQLNENIQKTFPALANLDRQKDFDEMPHETLPVNTGSQELDLATAPEVTVKQENENPPQPPITTSGANVSLIEQEKIKELINKLHELNLLFKQNSRYYHNAFYSILNPMRHRFIKTGQEISQNLQEMVGIMQDQIVFLTQNTVLASLCYDKALLKQAIKAADAVAKKQLTELDTALRSLRKKIGKYEEYLQLIMTNFEKKFKNIAKAKPEAFNLFEQEFIEFSKLLFPPELAQQYQAFSGTSQQNLLERMQLLAEKIQQLKDAPVITVKSVNSQQSARLSIIPIEQDDRVTTKNRASLVKPAEVVAEKSVKEWRKALSAEKGWKCEQFKSNKNQLIVKPKATKLSFVVDVTDNSFTYQPQQMIKTDRKMDLVAEEEKLIVAMVKAFLKTGSNKADLTGNAFLCEKAAGYLQANPAITVVKINGKVVYSNEVVPEQPVMRLKATVK